MTTTLEQIKEAKRGDGGGSPAVYLVKDTYGAVIGMLEKYHNTRTETHPWKAFHSFGMQRSFLGAYYTDEGGKSAAIKAIVDAR